MSTVIPGTNSYQTAIIGAGCAGLTLGYHLIGSKSEPIVLIDGQANRKDHLWSYWDNNHDSLLLPRPFIKKQWAKWAIRTQNKEVIRTGTRFKYVCLSSAHFESYLLKEIENANGTVLRENVTGLNIENGTKSLQLSNGDELKIENVYDSRPPLVSEGAMYQHFVGLTIQAHDPIFDDSTAILMDFRVSQSFGIHFVYVLPFSKYSALIESTVYSTKILPNSWYKHQICNYIEQNFPKTTFDIIGEETGALPLNNKYPQIPFGIPIGLSANAMRGSTGYAFSQIMVQLSELAVNIESSMNKITARSGSTFTEDLMDKIFLDVLSKSPKKAPDIFLTVLERLTGDEFAEFMTGYCPASTKAKIITSLPKALFIIAAIRRTFS
ncbi:lycopene cyclase family protein [Rhodospirillaceae bacterium]|nr:lycopene cyclase family protein [Rhodospirillaceae bacterium]